MKHFKQKTPFFTHMKTMDPVLLVFVTFWQFFQFESCNILHTVNLGAVFCFNDAIKSHEMSDVKRVTRIRTALE